MLTLYNYSSLKTRDTKIYNVGGYNISGGMSVDFLKIVAPVAAVFVFVGFLISLVFRIDMFNPFGAHFVWQYTVFWIAIGIGVGCGLYYIQFSGYRLYEYLIAYFKPKHVYKNDFRHSMFKLSNVKLKQLIKIVL